MRRILLVMLMVGTFSCESTSELIGELSVADEIAAEGMEEAFEFATIYNDSLKSCIDTGDLCDQTTINGYEQSYHDFVALYDMHHGNYSRNNNMTTIITMQCEPTPSWRHRT